MSFVVNGKEIPGLSEDAPWRLSKKYKRSGRTEDGSFVWCYTVGALAQALGKEPVTVRLWIRKGYIPDSQYRTERVERTLKAEDGVERGIRLWDEEQLTTIVIVASECGLLTKKPKSVVDSGFPARLRRAWATKGWPL